MSCKPATTSTFLRKEVNGENHLQIERPKGEVQPDTDGYITETAGVYVQGEHQVEVATRVENFIKEYHELLALTGENAITRHTPGLAKSLPLGISTNTLIHPINALFRRSFSYSFSTSTESTLNILLNTSLIQKRLRVL